PKVDHSTVWDPTTDQATPVELTTPRAGHVAALLADGRVLLAGGIGTNDDGSQGSLASAEVWDPRTGTSTPTGPMVSPRAFATAATLPDGRVLVYGGATFTIDPVDDTGGSVPVSVEAELYDPATGTFSPFQPDPSADAAPVDIIAFRGEAIGVRRLDLRSG